MARRVFFSFHYDDVTPEPVNDFETLTVTI